MTTSNTSTVSCMVYSMSSQYLDDVHICITCLRICICIYKPYGYGNTKLSLDKTAYVTDTNS